MTFTFLHCIGTIPAYERQRKKIHLDVLARTKMIEGEQYESEATAFLPPFESMVSSRWKCQVVLQTIRTVAMATLIKSVAFW
jgi:hypothetical protein